jgi:hypothetical protein
MRTWMRLLVALLLAFSFAAAALGADGVTTADRVDKLEKDVKKLQEDMAKIQSDLTKNALVGATTLEELRKIRESMDRLSRTQDVVRQPGYDPRSVNPSIPSVTAPPTTATIVLENVFSSGAWVRVNGQAYHVNPGETLPITAPVGTFQYSVEVDGHGIVNPLHNDRLPPSGYRIRIFPRMPL